jgi:hypothetical protein
VNRRSALLAFAVAGRLRRLFAQRGVLQARSGDLRYWMQSWRLIVRATSWSLGRLLVVISRNCFQADEALHSPRNKTRPTGSRSNSD